MKYDTAGKPIYEPIFTCNCGSTGGCNQCKTSFIGSITDNEAKEIKKKICEWKEKFNKDFEKRQKELEDLLTPLYQV
mgnify:FL=1